MTRLLILALVAVIVGPALASPDVLPVKGMAEVMRYDLATSRQGPLDQATRSPSCLIWSSADFTGYYCDVYCDPDGCVVVPYPATWVGGGPCGYWPHQGSEQIVLDWGDMNTGALVRGFGFAYATNALDGISSLITFYTDDNGWNQQGRDVVAGYLVTGLNGTITPGDPSLFWGWSYRVELDTPFTLAANDLDGDLLGDFSYTYWFDHSTVHPSGSIVGPVIAGDPNAGTAPGIEDVFDIYGDPNYVPADPNLTHYVGTYSFGGYPDYAFAQFYMELFGLPCPNVGESGRYCTGDIANFNCIVDLGDLAQLLAHYGCTAGCDRFDGDIDPWPAGDGAVDLADLAELLGQYGDNCN